MKIYLIGAGGVCSYLLPVLKRSVTPEDDIIVMDGDRLEERNLDRQLFDSRMVGEFKAAALAMMYNVEAINSYLTADTELPDADWLIVMVDNHKARRQALELVDRGENDTQVLVGANEYTDAQGYYYASTLQGLEQDPRVRWPEILTDDSNDPVSCQGEELVAAPQLAIANMMAAAYVMHLWYFYNHKADQVSFKYRPVLHESNFAKIQTYDSNHLQARA